MSRRKLVIRRYLVIVLFVLSVVLICGITAVLVVRSYQPERRDPFTDVPGASVQTLVELEGERAYPEAITVGGDGYLYSGSFCTGEIWRISPEGELEIWLAAESGIGAASGMDFDENGVLYIVDRGDCNPRRSTSSLKRVLLDKTVEDWGQVTEDEILNGLTFDANGVLYATDSQLGQVRVYDENGVPSVWWEVPDQDNEALPTGIAYDPNTNAIIVADSNNGTIYRVTIQPDGSRGEVTTVFENHERALDGLTVDDEGRIIFTFYDNHEVGRLALDGTLTVLARDFREPSDVAYLDGRIYVTNFDSVSLAPVVGILLDPALPFSIDVIDLRDAE